MSTADIDEAVLRERAHAMLDGRCVDLDFRRVYFHATLCDALTAAFIANATEVAELRAEVERQAKEHEGDIAAWVTSYDQRVAERDAALADVARLTKEHVTLVAEVERLTKERDEARTAAAANDCEGFVHDCAAALGTGVTMYDVKQGIATLVERCRALEGALERIGRTYQSERPGRETKCRMCCLDAAECDGADGKLCSGGIARRALTPSIPGDGA